MAPLTVLDTGRRLLVRCAGELSEGTIPQLEAQLRPYLERARSVMLDLSGVAFANSAGLRWLLQLDGGLRARQTPLRVLVRPGSRVERALSLTGYDQFVDLHRSARSAWRQF
jgi:anti-anti-sigma factor